MREIKGYTHTQFFRWKKSCHHLNMSLWFCFLKPKTSNEEKDKGNINGAGPSSTKIIEEELEDFKRGKDNPKREVIGKTIISEQNLEQV